MPHRSRFVDRKLAQQALALTAPAIEAALQDASVSGQHVLHLVVLDPSARLEACTLQDAVLLEHTLGNTDTQQWDADYAAFAREKAALSWRHGMDSRQLLLMEPHRLHEDDGLRWGGVCLQGIVVAASGAQPHWDEAFSLWVAAAVRALARERAATSAS